MDGPLSQIPLGSLFEKCIRYKVFNKIIDYKVFASIMKSILLTNSLTIQKRGNV